MFSFLEFQNLILECGGPLAPVGALDIEQDGGVPSSDSLGLEALGEGLRESPTSR